MLVKAQATAIANTLNATEPAAFPIALIIPIAEMLLQLLGNCWAKSAPSADSPSVHVADHYNAETDTFDEVILGQVRGQTRKAIRLNARQNNGARLKTFSEADVQAISSASLKQVMKQDTATCTSCLIEINQG